MSESQTDSPQPYLVVVNQDDAYSIWPEDPEMPIPVGWREPSEPCRGSKETCLEYIGRVWTDMRPLGLRTRPPDGA